LLHSDPLANSEPLIRRVYAYVAYVIGDGPDAEDITSAVFENALRYRSTYDPSRGKPATWLLGIARRCVAAALSERAASREAPTEVEAPAEVEAEAVDRLTLRAALNTLSERDRDLIALRYAADLRAREIAELLDLTTNAVEVALHRALTKLRAELETEQPQSGGAASVAGAAGKPM
jgi:RNA polymerase sigma factor (sigma-70 family)